MARAFGPRWGQRDKWGKPKCAKPNRANGGIKPGPRPKAKDDGK